MTDKYADLRAGLESLRQATGELRGPEAQVADLLSDYDRMRDALEHLIDRANDSDGACYGTLSTSFVRDTARAALAQEGP